MKIIISLRNPIDYAYSSYRFDKNSNIGRLVPNDFLTALKSSPKYVFYNPIYLRYYKYVKRYFDNFNEIFVVLYDDIVSNPEDLARRIYTFLGVNDSFIPTKILHKKVNPTTRYKNRYFSDFVYFFIQMINFFRLHFIISFIFRLNPLLFYKIFNSIFKENDRYKELTIKERKFVYNYFKDDINKLEKLINRNLKLWKLYIK